MGDPDPEGRTLAASLAPQPHEEALPDARRPVLAGRYEVLALLGAGAMGTVYRARDRELDEVVALKLLKREFASTGMVERFRREVKLARRVTHSNVARTYDIGEHEGDRFLTMEFIAGETLAAALVRRGRLPAPEVVRIGLDLSAGLAAAHEAGVLHRDLKPENVIVSGDGRAVITDFGIARTVSGSELSRTAGRILGTPAYMAPEQVEGTSDLDARADLYALGATLFELLTGQVPWQGKSAVSLAAARLLEPPPDVRSVVPSLPADLSALVRQLMARERNDRFSSAAETARALRRLAVSATSSRSAPQRTPPVVAPTPLPSEVLLPPIDRARRVRRPKRRVVAVLPVLNLGASEDAYLAECVGEDITDLLSVVPGLLVRPRGDTSRFVDPDREVREIGRAVGANVVIDASLRRFGDIVRASFRLITVHGGFQLWARRFDRPSAEVLSIAEDAARAIADAVTAERGARPPPQLASAEAEDLYLRGRFLLRRGWHGSQREAAELLARAAAHAPDNARILGMYALALARIYGFDSVGRADADHARAIAGRALELEQGQPEAEATLAIVHLQDGEPEEAVDYLRGALTVSPNSADALDWLGRLNAEVGRLDEGIALLERALAVEPEMHSTRLHLYRLRSLRGDRSSMARSFQDGPPYPGDAVPWFLLHTRDALWRSDAKTARRLRTLAARSHLPAIPRSAIERINAIILGDRSSLGSSSLADRMLPVDASRPPRRAAFNAQIRTELHMGLGAYDEAIESLFTADENGLVDLTWLSRCPLLAPIRERPELTIIRERVAARAEGVIRALDAPLSQS